MPPPIKTRTNSAQSGLFGSFAPASHDDTPSLPLEVEFGDEVAKKQPKSFTLSALLEMVDVQIQSRFSMPVWVQAEIVEFKKSAPGHIYLDLIERDSDPSKPKAKIRANIWATVAPRLLSKFKAATGSDVRSGIKVLLQARVALSPVYGLSLVVNDIDPAFTIGAMAAHLAKIRQQLQKEGVFGANKALPIPTDVMKVAIVAPEAAAGLGDFQHEAEIFHRFGVIRFKYFTAVFQGERASPTIVAAMQKASVTTADLIVVLRGGGGTADLQYLNDYAIARSICDSPIPVIVSVGHERDKTILDEVAAVSCGTPSKAIGYIASILKRRLEKSRTSLHDIRVHSEHICMKRREHIVRNMTLVERQSLLLTAKARHALQERMSRIRVDSMRSVTQKRNDVHLFVDVVQRNALRLVAHKRVETDQNLDTIKRYAYRAVSDSRKHAEVLFREIFAQRVEKTLERGFVLATNDAGVPVTSAEEARIQKKLTLKFHDNSITVKVEK